MGIYLDGSVGGWEALNISSDVETIQKIFIRDINIDCFDLEESIKIFQKIIKVQVSGIISVKGKTHKWLSAKNRPELVKIPEKYSDFGRCFTINWFLNDIQNIIKDYKKILKKEDEYDEPDLEENILIETDLSSSNDITLKNIYDIKISFPFFDSPKKKRQIYNLFKKYKFNITIKEDYDLLLITIQDYSNIPKMVGNNATGSSGETPPKGEGEDTKNANTASPDRSESPGSGSTENESNQDTSGGGKGTPCWVTRAKKEIGVKENKAPGEHNSRIIEYHSTTGKFKTDEIAWCASFSTWSLKSCNLSTSGCTAAARSFTTASALTKIDKPYFGCFIVFKYGTGAKWSGHVGILVGIKGGKYTVLGGNQSDSVKNSHFGKSKVYGFYWPSSEMEPWTKILSNTKSSEKIEETDYKSTR